MKTTYYSKPRTYGGRYFILQNEQEKSFVEAYLPLAYVQNNGLMNQSLTD